MPFSQVTTSVYNYVCRVVRALRLRFVLDLLRPLGTGHSRLSAELNWNAESKAELEWWVPYICDKPDRARLRGDEYGTY